MIQQTSFVPATLKAYVVSLHIVSLQQITYVAYCVASLVSAERRTCRTFDEENLAFQVQEGRIFVTEVRPSAPWAGWRGPGRAAVGPRENRSPMAMEFQRHWTFDPDISNLRSVWSLTDFVVASRRSWKVAQNKSRTIEQNLDHGRVWGSSVPSESRLEARQVRKFYARSAGIDLGCQLLTVNGEKASYEVVEEHGDGEKDGDDGENRSVWWPLKDLVS